MNTKNAGHTSDNARNRRLSSHGKKLLAPIVAAIMLAAVFAPIQTAEAFVLDISIPETVHKSETQRIPFSISLEIPPGELVSMSSITLAIDEGTATERIFTFDSDGRKISGTPRALVSNLEVTISPDTAIGQGYAYGYGLVSSGPAGSGSSVTSGSIGNGATNLVTGFVGPATITLEGTLRSAFLVREGTSPVTHSIRASIDTGAADSQQHILSGLETFTVIPVITRTEVSDTTTDDDLTAESEGTIIARSAKHSSDDDEHDSEIEYRYRAIVRVTITDEENGPRAGEPYAITVQAINTEDGSIVEIGSKEGIMKGPKKVLLFSESWETDNFGTYIIRTILTN